MSDEPYLKSVTTWSLDFGTDDARCFYYSYPIDPKEWIWIFGSAESEEEE